MASAWAGGLVGLFVVLWASARSVQGERVPAWAAAIGPLALFVGARRSLTGLTAGATDPASLAAHFEALVPVGTAWALLGVVLVLGALAGRVRGEGSPSLAAVGAATLAFAAGWGPWCEGEAALWRVVGEAPDVVEAARRQADAGFVAGWRMGLGVLLLVALPALALSAARAGFVALGEWVSAGVLAALVVGTGQPAARAVHAVYGPWAEVCADASVDGGFARHPAVRQARCGAPGPTG